VVAVTALTLYAAAMLGADHFVGRGGQVVLRLVTAAVLLAACRPLPVEERVQVANVVVVATCCEVIGSVIWGVYRYRLGNLPAFVPPGHGLVYLTGLRVSRLAPVVRHERGFIRLVLLLGLIWAGLGLSGLLGRVDVFGALGMLVFATYMCREPAPRVYGGVFIVVAWLELYGTAIGTWRWMQVVPGLGIPSGNPPSGVASGYVLFDIVGMALAPVIVAAGSRGREFMFSVAEGSPAIRAP
jgi:hypothetical protein